MQDCIDIIIFLNKRFGPIPVTTSPLFIFYNEHLFVLFPDIVFYLQRIDIKIENFNSISMTIYELFLYM